MTEQEIQSIVAAQRAFFATGATWPVDARLRALARLKAVIRAREQEICAALQADLGKSGFESYMCEVGLALSEVSYMQKHLRAFARPRTVPTPLAQFHARSYRQPTPRGVALIMSPWNYPFLLSVDPLADAIAAGCTVVLKPSDYSPHVSAVLRSLLADCFPAEQVAVVTGGRAENASLLDQKFDCIFFTGSQAVGRLVMERAAKHLTPVTLELGGKSPCIVERTADIALAARRIVFGKFLNCGQTCVAPDYILCDRAVKDALVAALKKEITRQFGSAPLQNKNYGQIINQKHFDRLLGLAAGETVAHGGGSDAAALRIEPTLLDSVRWEAPIMQEEIFGPLLPILTYDDLDAALAAVEARPRPLAFYLFTRDKALARRVMARARFGGGCVNDVVIHLATSAMPFGGVGESGMGGYHGRAGFDTFTHYKSIVDKKLWLDLPMRYQPYTAVNEKLLRLFLR